MYMHEDLTNQLDSGRLQRQGLSAEFDGDEYIGTTKIQEPIEGLVRYLKVKELLEEKYGRKINHHQMGKIFSEVLKQSTHEKRCKKLYGEARNHWKKRLYKQSEDKGLV